MSDLRSEIVAEARKWRHTRWKDKGRGPQGIDCIGLCELPAKALGLVSPSFEPPRNYSAMPTGELPKWLERAGCRKKRLADRLPGDILTLTQARLPGHLGMYTKNGETEMLLHAHAKRRMVIEERLLNYLPGGAFQARITACYALPGVDD